MAQTLTVYELADKFKISRIQVYRLCKEHGVKIINAGKKKRIENLNGVIYLINIKPGIIYIGETVNIKNRIALHKRLIKKRTHTSGYINKLANEGKEEYLLKCFDNYKILNQVNNKSKQELRNLEFKYQEIYSKDNITLGGNMDYLHINYLYRLKKGCVL